jgi:hypothetical protein
MTEDMVINIFWAVKLYKLDAFVLRACISLLFYPRVPVGGGGGGILAPPKNVLYI